MPVVVQAPREAIVVPGNHDGVHLGHQALLQRAVRLVREGVGRRVVALFFDPHPRRLLHPEQAPEPLSTVARRVELLRRAGADDVAVLTFDRQVAAMEPEAFVEQVLLGRLGARAVVVGADFRFGRGRRGDVEGLRRWGQRHRLRIEVVEPVLDAEGRPVGSSLVREALRRGDVQQAARMLGRPYDVEGRVVRGAGRGRSLLGLPTANVAAAGTLLPADGVYAVWVRRLDRPQAPLLGGAASVGRPPQFPDAPGGLEVHLLDFDGGLLGERLRVAFAARLRAMRRFEDVRALREAMRQDVQQARRLLEEQWRVEWTSWW